SVSSPRLSLPNGVTNQCVFHVEIGCVYTGLPEPCEHWITAFEVSSPFGRVLVRNDANRIHRHRRVNVSKDDQQIAEYFVFEDLPNLLSFPHDIAVTVTNTPQ